MNDSREEGFDWHDHGVWVVINPHDLPMLETASTTPYSCRSDFVRGHNIPWSRASTEGFYVHRFVRAQ
jgi:hypothetical protein